MLKILDQEAILQVIQPSITPVILISGLGALVISLTTRMGRIVDRTRSLAVLVTQAKGSERDHVENQLKLMWRRAKIMRMAMTLIASSMFTSGLLIMLLFVSAIFELKMAGAILSVFMLSVIFMLCGLAAFIRDVFVSLNALNFEVERALARPPG